MKDRFTRGLIAGIVAGIAMNLVNFFTHYVLRISDLRLLDWASILIHGSVKPHNLGEFFFALSGQIMFAGFIGIIYAFLIIKIESRNYILKGIILSLIVWFSTYTITLLFNKVKHIMIGTAVANLLATLTYGIVLAQTLRWLDYKVLSEDQVKPKKEKRAFKFYFVPFPARKLDKKTKRVQLKRPLKIKKGD